MLSFLRPGCKRTCYSVRLLSRAEILYDWRLWGRNGDGDKAYRFFGRAYRPAGLTRGRARRAANATPFHGVEKTVSHTNLESAAPKNIAFAGYESDHRLYRPQGAR